jgi:hypothetical protein
MSIFKRGSVYWYHFLFNGEHIQKSTKQGNPRTARQIEAAYKTALAKSEVGITERKKAPGFKAAVKAFLEWSEGEHKEHPATHRRYKVSSIALLSHFGYEPIDRITPEAVEAFKTARALESATAKGKEKGKRKSTGKRIRPATLNRELACLKALFNHALKSDFTFRNPVSRVDFLTEGNEQTRVAESSANEIDCIPPRKSSAERRIRATSPKLRVDDAGGGNSISPEPDGAGCAKEIPLLPLLLRFVAKWIFPMCHCRSNSCRSQKIRNAAFIETSMEQGSSKNELHLTKVRSESGSSWVSLQFGFHERVSTLRPAFGQRLSQETVTYRSI